MGAATADWANFLETWFKFPNNLTRVKVGSDETMGLFFSERLMYKVLQGLEDTNSRN